MKEKEGGERKWRKEEGKRVQGNQKVKRSEWCEVNVWKEKRRDSDGMVIV